MIWLEAIGIGLLGGVLLLARPLRRRWRVRSVTRGRRLSTPSRPPKSFAEGLRLANHLLPERAATQHFLVVGTTGSGKSLLQRLLMRDPLRRIGKGRDDRALVFDAKGDTADYLRLVGVTCPVYSLNPFQPRDDRPSAPVRVAWDIGKDITTPARSLNLSAALVPAEPGDANRYFTDAARLVLDGIVTSFMRHAGDAWTLADLVHATSSRERVEQVLHRDERGREVLDTFLGDSRTGYAVVSTIASRMRYYTTVAALWQRTERALSLRDWLRDASVLLLGEDEIASVALNTINEVVFRVLAEEIDLQGDSSSRRTWLWLDEVRLAEGILRSGKLQRLAVKGRSRGACLVLAFQDLDGFRMAAGREAANEIVAQCANKALLRMASDESASWAAKVLGQYETLEVRHADTTHPLSVEQRSEQRMLKDAVLPSEFFEIAETSPANGLSGYFVSVEHGARRDRVSPDTLRAVAVGERADEPTPVPEADQWLRPWTAEDLARLGLSDELERRPDMTPDGSPRLRLRRRQEQERSPKRSE